jgi:hypothetical protein
MSDDRERRSIHQKCARVHIIIKLIVTAGNLGTKAVGDPTAYTGDDAILTFQARLVGYYSASGELLTGSRYQQEQSNRIRQESQKR